MNDKLNKTTTDFRSPVVLCRAKARANKNKTSSCLSSVFQVSFIRNCGALEIIKGLENRPTIFWFSSTTIMHACARPLVCKDYINQRFKIWTKSFANIVLPIFQNFSKWKTWGSTWQCELMTDFYRKVNKFSEQFPKCDPCLSLHRRPPVHPGFQTFAWQVRLQCRLCLSNICDKILFGNNVSEIINGPAEG